MTTTNPTSNERLMLREDGKPYSPDMELSWKTFLGNRGAMSPDFWEVARIAYIAAWHASLTYAKRRADETTARLPRFSYIMCESSEGHGKIVLGYETLAMAHEAHRILTEQRLTEEPTVRTESDCSTGIGGVTLVQMAENMKLGLDPYTGSQEKASSRRVDAYTVDALCGCIRLVTDGSVPQFCDHGHPWRLSEESP